MEKMPCSSAMCSLQGVAHLARTLHTDPSARSVGSKILSRATAFGPLSSHSHS